MDIFSCDFRITSFSAIYVSDLTWGVREKICIISVRSFISCFQE